jgi:hypothetical protein
MASYRRNGAIFRGAAAQSAKKKSRSELLDFVEAEAKANVAFHIANGDALAKESNTLLNLLLVGAGGAIAYAINLSGKEAWQQFGMATSAIYLFGVAGILLDKCLRAVALWPPSNEPQNYPLQNYSLEQIKEAELSNRQKYIHNNRLRNEVIAMWLNRCRVMAACTPLIFLSGAVVALVVDY